MIDIFKSLLRLLIALVAGWLAARGVIPIEARDSWVEAQLDWVVPLALALIPAIWGPINAIRQRALARFAWGTDPTKKSFPEVIQESRELPLGKAIDVATTPAAAPVDHKREAPLGPLPPIK